MLRLHSHTLIRSLRKVRLREKREFVRQRRNGIHEPEAREREALWRVKKEVVYEVRALCLRRLLNSKHILAVCGE